MIGIGELKSILNRISYVRLLKDTKKAGINVSKLRMPEKDISSHLVSARVRAMLKVVFEEIKIKATKERYYYRWYVWVEELEKIYRENQYEFYKFFGNHPDVKSLEDRYNFDLSSGRYFTVFDNHERSYNDYTLEYNPDLLKEIKRYREYVDMILAIYPEVKRQWTEYQKLSIQQRYDAIVAKKARAERRSL